MISSILRYSLNPESDNTTPIFCLSSILNLLISLLNNLTVPLSTEIRPKTALKVVLLPAPFCPISPVTQPALTSKEQLSLKRP